MNKIPTQLENPKGLHQRYVIRKLVPMVYAKGTVMEQNFIEEQKVDENAEYFVMRLDYGGKDHVHIEACRMAVLVYAYAIKDHLPELSKDLIDRYGS